VGFLREVVERGFVRLADFRRHFVGDGSGLLVDLLQEQRGADGILDFVEGLGMGGLLVEDLDDVKTVLGFDEVGDFALGKAKSGLLKFGNRLPLEEPTEVPSFGLGAGVLGVFLGEVFKTRALFASLGEDIVGLFLDFGDLGVGFADGGEKNVLGVDAVGDFVLLNILLISDLQLVVGDGGVLANLVEIEETETNDTLLWDLVLGLVLFVVGLDLGLIGNDFFSEIFGLDENVVELDFLVFEAELFLNFGGSDADAVSE